MQEFMYYVQFTRRGTGELQVDHPLMPGQAWRALTGWPRGAEHRWWGAATEGQVLAHTGELSLGLPARQSQADSRRACAVVLYPVLCSQNL